MSTTDGGCKEVQLSENRNYTTTRHHRILMTHVSTQWFSDYCGVILVKCWPTFENDAFDKHHLAIVWPSFDKLSVNDVNGERCRLRLFCHTHLKKWQMRTELTNLYFNVFLLLVEILHRLWWKGVATLPWGARDIHLYFNQHYTYAPGAFCYALSTADTSTATGQESPTCWSLTVSWKKKERDPRHLC